MKVLVTGSKGFIGTHLCTEFESNGYEVLRSDLSEGDGYIAMDITDPQIVLHILEEYKPDILVNMAGQADVGLSWKKPQLTVNLNTIGAINILEAVNKVNPKMRVLTIGSSDEYGSLKEQGMNVTENTVVNPITPYAISKQAQETFSQLYNRSYNMNICMVRMFNLGGPGQTKGYLISDFSSGIAEIEAGLKEYMRVGNLNSARDFTHVKDACKAVRMIVENGHSGEVYNISSGTTYKVQEVLDKLIMMAHTEIKVVQDPTKMRPSDTPIVCGNHNKLTELTGWQPERTIDEILEDALNYWRFRYAIESKG